MNRMGFDDFKKRLSQMESELATEQERAQSILEAAQVLGSMSTKEKRRAAQAVNYQKKKLEGALARGGFGNKFSKVVASLIETPDESKEIGLCDSFDCEKVVYWDSDEDHEKSKLVVAAVKQLQDYCSSTIQDKVRSCTSYLNEYDNKSGVSVHIAYGTGPTPNLAEIMDIGLAKNECLDMPGSSPWLLALRPNAFRFGCSAFPLPGIACLLQLAASSPPMTLILMPLLHIIEAGMVTLRDLPNFFKTGQGQELVKKVGCVFHLTQTTQVFYIPFGYLCIPLARESGAEQDNEPPGSFVWHVPMFTKDAFKKLHHRVWEPIKLMNMEHIKPLSGQAPWKMRLDVIEKMCNDRSWELLNPDLMTPAATAS